MLKKKGIAPMLLGIIAAIASYAVFIWLRSLSGEGPLTVKWEGAVISRNARDIGASMNECLKETVFREGLIERANVWFSGWSCAGVGHPDVIYSLNHDPKRDELYFCRADSQNLVGRYFNNAKRLNNLEFLSSWEDEETRKAACAFFSDSFHELSAGKHILVHCDAGKDRTGTYAALVSALALEAKGLLDDQVLEAIECDYRKSGTLEEAKFGRMRSLIATLRDSGGVAAFFTRTCGIEPPILQTVASKLLVQPRN